MQVSRGSRPLWSGSGRWRSFLSRFICLSRPSLWLLPRATFLALGVCFATASLRGELIVIASMDGSRTMDEVMANLDRAVAAYPPARFVRALRGAVAEAVEKNRRAAR